MRTGSSLDLLVGGVEVIGVCGSQDAWVSL